VKTSANFLFPFSLFAKTTDIFVGAIFFYFSFPSGEESLQQVGRR
jgi:hypothetical protein